MKICTEDTGQGRQAQDSRKLLPDARQMEVMSQLLSCSSEWVGNTSGSSVTTWKKVLYELN